MLLCLLFAGAMLMRLILFSNRIYYLHRHVSIP